MKTSTQQAALVAAQPDLLIVAAYGLILPPTVLAIPRLGCVNVHASLLPRWRGAAPIERAMLAGDCETGVTLMQMDAGLDTGPMLDRAAVRITPGETGEALERRLATLGAARLLACLPDLLRAALRAEPQDDDASTYAPKLSRADTAFEWSHPALDIARRINALAGRQSVEASIGGARVQLLAASAAAQLPIVDAHTAAPGTILSTASALLVRCGTGCLELQRLRFIDRGKGIALDARAAVNGFAELLRPGAQFNGRA